MNEYELDLTTTPGTADAALLDRLAVLIYNQPGLIDPLIGLNEDGSLSASFCVWGSDLLAAVRDGVRAFLVTFTSAAAGADRVATNLDAPESVSPADKTANGTAVESLTVTRLRKTEDEAMALALEAQHSTRSRQT